MFSNESNKGAAQTAGTYSQESYVATAVTLSGAQPDIATIITDTGGTWFQIEPPADYPFPTAPDWERGAYGLSEEDEILWNSSESDKLYSNAHLRQLKASRIA